MAPTVVVNAQPCVHLRAWRAEAPTLLEAAIRLSQVLGATLMMPGNVYNFGESMPPLLREDTAQAALGVKGRIRIAMEQRLDGHARRQPARGGHPRRGLWQRHPRSWLDQAIAMTWRAAASPGPGPLDTATPGPICPTWPYPL